ncbi:hypothetical protein CVIRNUC_002449 [Coccomyxa viridis]|uniref:F-box domain-containing protein n=1 Tax=Coccomyxa viridis TaxID=1274662 RepID=A0AAV1HZ05_9CHLO|nr:hypothetical protein CVIRNUC_002449 [Coccomyxa viridis]
MSELSDLPDGCTQLVLEFLSIRDVAACAASCKKMAALAQEPLMWIPRLKADFGVDIKARLQGEPGGQVDARELYRLASEAPSKDAIRFWGCFTDGGCDDHLRQYWVDNMFAPNPLESYCSALSGNVNCIGLLMEPNICENADASKEKYREYLLDRLRVPAGVIFGHGIVNLALIQQEQDFDGAVMERLRSYSLAELEHLFLEFYVELTAGHTIGRLLLHGLQGEDRERERSNLNAVASRAERNLHTKHNNLCFHPESRDIQFDSEALPLCGAHGFTRSVGIVERLRVSRAGQFSCPVLAGVVFLAHFDGDAVSSPQEVFDALQAARDSPVCKAFNGLKDEKAMSQAVRKGVVPRRTKYVVSSSGVHYNFAQQDILPSDTPHAAIGHLQPVAWFRFHNRRDYKRWATLTSPKTLWEGQDSDYDIRRTRRHTSTRGASPIPQGAAADYVEDHPAAAAPPAAQVQAHAGGLAQFVGDVQEMAQAWLGGASHAAMQDSDSDTDMSEAESDSDDGEVFDEEGSPRGTKGRDMMHIELQGRWAGNLALVKLIDQEDLMHEWEDQHDEPNIDINHVTLSGSVLQLPEGVSLSAA